MAQLGLKTKRILGTVDPELEAVVIAALLAAPPWLDFAVISGKRTASEQNALWEKGRDGFGTIVDKKKVVTYKDGYVKKSRHQGKKAIDIVAFVKGKPNWSKSALSAVAGYIIGFAAARGVGLTGGLKWNWDIGHIEMEG